MLVERFGEVQDVEPARASVEFSIVRALRKKGPMRQRDLWYRSAAHRIGRESFEQVLSDLIQRRVIVRESTHRVDSFLIRMAPDTRRRERAGARGEGPSCD